ncbi:hypothetical protein [Candidatus Korobacter versatilis]|uniref:hypothetical protein n=1 Tax=Candidatus Korobacter versatilis TaxID=658062 RepID=UPI0005A47BB1|nr:hypothetical protein [Candidatus Koribacter versatilis]
MCSIAISRFESDLALFLVFAIFGTLGWWLINEIGWSSSRNTISRVSSAFGALLAALFGWTATYTGGIVRQDFHDAALTVSGVVQYALIIVLWAGAWTTVASAVLRVFRKPRAELA